MTDTPSKTQTTEEMQAAARRIIERQEERRAKRQRGKGSHRPERLTLPAWLTPEKLAYHESLMRRREAEHQAQEAAHMELLRVAEETSRERRRVAGAQQRQRETLREALGQLEKQALSDALAQGLVEGTWPLDEPLREELVQALYRSRVARVFTALEQQVFAKYAFQTRWPLPFVAGHPFMLVDVLYSRLEPKAQLSADLSGLLGGREVSGRLVEQVQAQGQEGMDFLLKAAETTSGLVERLPWQLQYRVAISWLLAEHPRLPAVPWERRVAAALTLAHASTHMAARKALDNLFDEVAITAYHSTEPLDFTPLVPPCRVGYVPCTHCEGRPWPRKPGVAYCPTLRSGCRLDRPSVGLVGEPSGRAWITPNSALPPFQWSVLELLHHAGFKPMDLYPELPSDEDLVSRLGGWLNRLNKIRSRLRCRSCQSILQPKKKYAKFLAKFPVTVFTCDHHPTPVKLTQCWLCDDLIDSRESPYFDGHSTYNLCRGCGAGAQAQATIGRRCPGCGEGPMRLTPLHPVSGRRQVLMCSQRSCGHQITLTEKQRVYLAHEVLEPSRAVEKERRIDL